MKEIRLFDESKNTVHIVRIMYGGRNIKKQLNETAINQRLFSEEHRSEMAGAFLMPVFGWKRVIYGDFQQFVSVKERPSKPDIGRHFCALAEAKEVVHYYPLDFSIHSQYTYDRNLY